MVSLWPWKGDDSSPAAFEKSLSEVSKKITQASADLEITRQHARRYKALWTLYASFVYTIYVLIIALVVGWQACGATEYTSISAGPLIIYLVRYGLTAYYEYRLSTYQKHLTTLTKQRETTINKLKDATKYNTTQQLLEKYGGAPPTPKNDTPKRTAKPKQNTLSPPGQRTGFAPPPTANIQPRNQAFSTPNSPHPSSPPPSLLPPHPASAVLAPWSQQELSAEFAPNAFPSLPSPRPQSSHSYASSSFGPKWYDRLMDVLLGDDETNPKNRIVLICKECRLVNGQAPPGVKTLEGVGRWRCSGCGTMNGVESEAVRIVKAIERGNSPPQVEGKAPLGVLEDAAEELKREEWSEGESTKNELFVKGADGEEQGDEDNGDEEEEETPKRKRGRPKGSGKKNA